LVGFAKVTRDLTERRETQIALEKTREALFQSQKLEAVGKLTGGVAHDFNNLLMVILSSLELSQRRLPEDPRLKMLQQNALDAAQRGVALTQRMLAFARRQELKVEKLDFRALVTDLKELLERSLSASVELKVRIPHNLPAIKADANQLENAVLNLVLNARDAMPKGGAIVISARTETFRGDDALSRAAGPYLVLTVDDAGEGMDAETLSRAAEPFFTTKGVGKGTGLGLSMVQGMAEQLGGWLDLQSTQGKGTTVAVWLPVADVKAFTAEERRTADSSAADQGARRTILVVDDDRLVLSNTAMMLEEMGHLVVAASSGAAALAELGSNSDIDLVISDQAMPHMTGAELADVIRREHPEVPVILVSGYAELPAGVNASIPRLSKPFSLGQLSKLLPDLAPL
jgi:nitrogen-specific signal transduction histidine kinase